MKRLFAIFLILIETFSAQSLIEKSWTANFNESDIVLKVTSIEQYSYWKNDLSGKHIYTKSILRIDEVIKGNFSELFLTIELIGGRVQYTTEYVSHSIVINNNSEMILMLSTNDPSKIDVTEKINIVDNKIFIEETFVDAKKFISFIKNANEENIILPDDSKSVLKQISATELIYQKIENFSVPANQLQKISNPLALSNLTPFKPANWSAQIVVSTVTGDNIDATSLNETNNLYIDWAVANYGPDDINTSFLINLYVDNVLTAQWNASGLPSGYYVYVSDLQLDPLSSGNHTIKIQVDPTNVINETDETDNEYTKNISVDPVAGLPSITNISPLTASAGTGSRITISGNNFGAVRGSSKVLFHYRSGQPKIESSNYFSWSNTSIECEVPIGFINDYPASASSGPVSVSTNSGTSIGYNFSVTFSYGDVKWNVTPANIPIRINQNTNDLVGEGEEILAAAGNWSSAGAQFAFKYDGTTNLTDATFDGINEVMWGSTSGSLATTYYWYVGNSILEVDMVFNDSYNWSKDGSQFDVQSIALHEFGHWLNLRDIYGGPDSYKIMYGFSSSGVLKRNLTAVEIDGIKWIYGIGSVQLSAPVLSSPVNFSSNIERNPILIWNRVIGSNVLYRIQVSQNSNFSSTIYDVSNLSNNQYQLSNLSYNTTYYWRVNASNATNGTSDWPESWSFSTIAQSFIVTTSANPIQGGLTSGSGTFNSGTIVNLNASPNTGYYFLNWTEGGNIVSVNSNYTFALSNDRNLVANFDFVPSISVIKPNGGEQWQENSIQEITWSSVNVNNVKIEYSTNNGLDWITIINSIPASSAKYNWTIPNALTTQAKIKISSTTNGLTNDISDNVFTISPIPSLSLIQPNGGENWQRLSSQEIKWNSSGIQNVKIEYSTNDGNNWTLITNSSTASTGIYNWTLPNIPSQNYKVRISNALNEALFDLSESVFTIGPIPNLTLDIPNGGENFLVGVPNSIRWISENIASIKIEYTTNNGLEWLTITNSTSAATKIYNWLIPKMNSSQAKIRISDTENFINKVSNSPFNIVGVTRGDVNEDGEINGIDATLILRHLVGISTLGTRQQYAADANLDNNIQAYDAYAILYFVLNGNWP
jgi:hypothetical protein